MRYPFRLFIAGLLALSACPAMAVDLLTLYEQTLATNPTLKGQELAVEKAVTQEDQAFSRLLPQVNAVGNLSFNENTQRTLSTRQMDTTRYEGLRGVIQAKQALFDLPSYLKFQGAGYAVQQSQQELESATMTLVGSLIDWYFKVLEAQDTREYLEGDKRQTEGQIKRLRHMHERQLSTVTDLYEVEAYYQTLVTQGIDAENDKAVALENLREITGLSVTEVAPLVKDDLPDVPGEANQWLEEAGRNHPVLAALQYAIDAAQKIISSSRAEHLPKLSLQMSEIYSDNAGFDNRQIPRYTLGTVGLQVDVPLYAGGGVEAGVREAVVRYNMAMEQKTEKLREIERRTRTAFLDAKTGRARINSTKHEVGFREKAQQAREKSYEYGAATIIDVLESKKNLLKARFEQAKARYDYIRSLVALRLWTGALKQQDIEEINGWLANAASSKPSASATR